MSRRTEEIIWHLAQWPLAYCAMLSMWMVQKNRNCW
jgi:hypothetical protein